MTPTAMHSAVVMTAIVMLIFKWAVAALSVAAETQIG